MVAWERSLDSDFVMRSENAWSLLGLGSSDTEEFRRLIHPEDRAKVEELLDDFEIGQSETIEVRYLTPDQRQIWLGIRAEKTSSNKAIGITFDITDRKLAEGEIWQTANHDALTGLPNRALFQLRFDALLDEARRDASRVALMLVDLDEFKDVNDTLGHGAGDELLREAGRRLQELAGARAEVARIGGDEFALILSHVDDERDALGFAERIVVAMRESYAFDGRSLSTRASIGLALFPDHHQDQAELMKDADMALYQAKAEGRSRVSLYRPAIRERMEARIRVGQEVRDALERGEIQPFYQPKICFRTGAIVGFEALARWVHPQRGPADSGLFRGGLRGCRDRRGARLRDAGAHRAGYDRLAGSRHRLRSGRDQFRDCGICRSRPRESRARAFSPRRGRAVHGWRSRSPKRRSWEAGQRMSHESCALSLQPV